MMHAKINLIIMGLALCVNLNAEQSVKKLHYNYNQNVTIWISNQPCTNARIRNQFPWAAEAVRKDGDILPGCFNGENDTVTIQWIGGDQSRFPANYFLINKDQSL